MQYPPITTKNREVLVVCPLCRKTMYYYALVNHLKYPAENMDECYKELRNLNRFLTEN